jgi:hypothetical protein
MSSGRLVTFADTTIEVLARDQDALKLVDFLFARFPQTTDVPPCLELELASDGSSTFVLWREGSLVYRDTTAVRAAQLLLAEAAHRFAVNSRDALLIHAAAVELDDRRILLPGPSGTGKSTLVAWLDQYGFGCHSDEMVIVSHDTRLSGYARPICLELDARFVVPEFLDKARSEGRLLEGTDALMAVGRSPISAPPVVLHCILFPRFSPRARTVLRPLSKGAAAMKLMISVANRRQLGDHGFSAVADLARAVPAFEFTYGRLDKEAISHMLGVVVP